jgi:phosphatidylserine/phosphatidylglycerophosphate/cardiolipin synthase-like enzyme
MVEMMDAAPGRVAVFGIENHASTPIYVHAKCCIIDDTWSTIGSDNFNRRSWTHDSELSAVVLDQGPDPQAYGRELRLRLAAEHLDRHVDSASLLAVMGDCVEPDGMFEAYQKGAAALDAWHEGGCVGARPPGRLRRIQPPHLSRLARALALPVYLTVHDPDGRPRHLRHSDRF